MPISDKYIDLNGFLEGDDYYPLQWSTVTFESEPVDSEWDSIEWYKIKAREFLQNVSDLNLPDEWSLKVNRAGSKAIVKSNMYPNKHRAKSVYLDFRHFIAKKEPSQFQRVIRTLCKNIKMDDPLKVFLNQLNVRFIENKDYGIKTDGKSLTVAKLIKIWFNTEYFMQVTLTNKKIAQSGLLYLKIKVLNNYCSGEYCVLNIQSKAFTFA
jgi:hypothetical protein